jgi:DNA repair exonuclease SbcCD ATPase subunit
MTGGFESNVPARKPRTKIARVISELTSEPGEWGELNETTEPDNRAESAGPVESFERAEGAKSDSSDSAQALEDAPRTIRSAALVAHPRSAESEAAAAAMDTPRGVPSTHAPGPAPELAPAPKQPAADTAAPYTGPLAGGREQIARLRERLAASAHPATGALEPQRTADAVRNMVDGLRERLETTARERTDLARALEEARAALARSDADLKRERRARQGLEAQAEERRRITEDAVAEVEALAAERDQVLGELTEHRRLESEQTSLLKEVEAALAEREAEQAEAAREVAEARDLASLRAAEIADLKTRLQDEAAARSRVEAKCRELEAEIKRLTEATEALEAIEGVLGRRSEARGADDE